MPREVSAGAVIFYVEESGNIKFLLLKHGPDSWDFPKGLVEAGEKLQEAALRECKEETGIEIAELMPGFKETIKFFFKVKYDYQVKRGLKMGQVVLKFVTYFLARAKTKDVKVSFEHEGYEWVTIDQAVKILKKRKESRDLLKKASSYIIKHGKF